MENASNRLIYFSQLLFTLSAEQSGLDPSPLPPLLSAGTPAYSNINGTAKLTLKQNHEQKNSQLQYWDPFLKLLNCLLATIVPLLSCTKILNTWN
jgi:hypothetical protein